MVNLFLTEILNEIVQSKGCPQQRQGHNVLWAYASCLRRAIT